MFEGILDYGTILVTVVTALAAVIKYLKYRNDQNILTLPPVMTLSMKEFVKEYSKGHGHRMQLQQCEISPVYRLPIKLPTISFIISDPTIARLVMMGDSATDTPELDKSVRYEMLKKMTGGVNSILTKDTKDKSWEVARKAVAHSFSKTNLHKLLPQMNAKLNEFVEVIDDHILKGKQLTDLPEWMVRVTVDFMAEGMFKSDYHTIRSQSKAEAGVDIESEGQAFMKSMSAITKEFFLRGLFRPWRKFLFWDKQVMKEIAEAHEGVTAVNNIGKRVLERYRAQHTEEEMLNDTSIIAHLIRSPYPSEQERIADITIFMFAGHDTTAYQVSWIIIELARNPECVKKLRVELDAIFPFKSSESNGVAGGVAGGEKEGDKEGEKEGEKESVPHTARPVFHPQHSSQLPYLSMVIKEGQRLWPVTSVGTSRTATKDIPYKDKIIPKGSICSIAFFAMFRTSKIRSPHEYIPERWLDTDPDAETLKEIFCPFSVGKRSCVGQNLAQLELMLFIATFFYFYDFELVSEVTELLYLTLKPKNADFKITNRKI